MQDPRMKKKTVKEGYGVAYLRGGFRLLGVIVIAIGGFCGGDGDGINDGEVFGGFLSLILSFSCFLFFFLYLFFLSPSPIYKFKINIFFYLKTLLLFFFPPSLSLYFVSLTQVLLFLALLFIDKDKGFKTLIDGMIMSLDFLGSISIIHHMVVTFSKTCLN